MRVLNLLLATVLVLSSASGAAAQVSNAATLQNASSNRQSQSSTGVGVGVGIGGSSSSIGVNTNTNTLSTGNNLNANENTNNQFQGVGTYNGTLDVRSGANNGELEVYSGASPYQGIIFEGSAPLPQLPGLLPTPGNFSQPYKPDVFVNGPAFLPSEMTVADAKACRDSKIKWYGGSRGESQSIKLYYSVKNDTPKPLLTMSNYVGTAMATTTDGPFLAALCEAAYKAMDKGATVGVVDFIVRPRNTMSGLGFGASGGGTGLPMAGVNPYALAGTLGFGTGWSNQKVEGEVMVQLTALRDSTKPASAPTRSASAVGTPVNGSESVPGAAAVVPAAKPAGPAVPSASAPKQEAPAQKRDVAAVKPDVPAPKQDLSAKPAGPATSTDAPSAPTPVRAAPVAAAPAPTTSSASAAAGSTASPKRACGGAYNDAIGSSFVSCD
jgi:hypothetical protein